LYPFLQARKDATIMDEQLISQTLKLSEECLNRLEQRGIKTVDGLLSCNVSNFMEADFGIVCFKELHAEMKRAGYAFSGE
jgi:hypothetical protein